MKKIGRELKGALFGALLASAGCAGEEAESKDIKDLKQDSAKVEIYKGKEKVNPEDDVFVVPDKEDQNNQDSAVEVSEDVKVDGDFSKEDISEEIEKKKD